MYLASDVALALERAGHTVRIHRISVRPDVVTDSSWSERSLKVTNEAGVRTRSTSGATPSAAQIARTPFAGTTQRGAWLAERIAHDMDDGSVLHALDDVAGAASLAARSLTGVPVVMRGRRQVRPDTSALVRRLRQACLRAADAVVAPSAPDVHAMLRIGVLRERLLLIPDAVVVPEDGQPGHRPAKTNRVVSLAGAGGAGVLVRALRWAPTAELVLAGASAPGTVDRLMIEAKRLGVNERVDWRGWVGRDEALRLLDQAALAACPGPPGAGSAPAVEAMWRGRAVVAADLPPLSDTVAHGTTGLLVAPDDPRALGTAVRELLHDPFRCEAFGQAGADRAAARYSPVVVAAALEHLYSQLRASGVPRLDDIHPGSGKEETA